MAVFTRQFANRREADEVVCLLAPEFLHSIGQFYEEFSQVDDGEVLDILRAHQKRRTDTTRGHGAGQRDKDRRGSV